MCIYRVHLINLNGRFLTSCIDGWPD